MKKTFKTIAVIVLLTGFFAALLFAGEEKVSMGGDVTVERGEVVEKVVVSGGDATVLGEVENECVVLEGDLLISGKVGGSVSVIEGDVVLEDGAMVEGDVSVTGGEVTLEDRATVKGDVHSGEDVTLKDGATVEGNVHSREDVTLEDGATVKGDVICMGGEISKAEGAVIGGKVTDMNVSAIPPMNEWMEKTIEGMPPLQVQSGDSERVSFGNNVVVEKGEIAEEVVVIGGNAVVLGEVKGDCVAIGGNLSISGKIGGDACAIGGNIDLKNGAEIKGDTVCIGGRLQKSKKAKVDGERVSIGLFPQFNKWIRRAAEGRKFWQRDRDLWPRDIEFLTLIGTFLAVFLFLLVLSVIIVAVWSKQIKTIDEYLLTNPGKSFFAGVIGIMCIPVFLTLLVVSLVGIIFIPLAILLIAATLIMGGAAAAVLLGRKILEALKLNNPPILGSLVCGMIILGIVKRIPFMIGFFLWLAVMTAGFGAVLITRYGNVKQIRPANEAEVVS